LIDQGWRERIHIDFQTKGERSPWAQPRPNTAELATFDRAVQLQLIAPECLIAERIESGRFASPP